jgi:FAD/FMN-containing dehydrogenase
MEVLHRLQGQLDGDIYFSDSIDVDDSDDGFAAASAVWVVNATWQDAPPLAIIEVSNEGDVRTALPVLARLAKGPWKVPFRVRSGGHHKAGYSTVSGGVVLSLVRMNHFAIDDDDDIPVDGRSSPSVVVAVMGPSVRSWEVVEKAVHRRGYGGVVGFCGTVAESGFVLGGGFGVQSRLYGLGLDQLISVNVVLADGTLLENVTSAPGHHPDLFWALRGAGGGNFGVVTQMEYTLHPTHSEVVFVLVRFDDPQELAYSMYMVGELQKDWPGNLCVMQDTFLELHFIWTGQNRSMVDEGLSFIYGEVVPSVLSPTAASAQGEDGIEIYDMTLEWRDMTAAPDSKRMSALASKFKGNSNQNASDWGRSVWRAKCWTGFLHPVNNTLPVWETIIGTMTAGIRQINDLIGKELVLPDIELWGGAMNDAAAWNGTAFPHRSAIYNVGVLFTIPVDEVNPTELYGTVRRHVQSWWPQISQYLTGSYINYPDIDLVDNRAYLDVYFGGNLPRLVDVKRRYDPDNVFVFPMSIPT